MLLNVSKKEAETLQIILANIGGDPNLSARKHADTLLAKVNKLLVWNPPYVQHRGCIYF